MALDIDHYFDALVRIECKSLYFRDSVAMLVKAFANIIVQWCNIKDILLCKFVVLDRKLTGDNLAHLFGIEQLAGGLP